MLRLFWRRPRPGQRNTDWRLKARMGQMPALYDTEAQALAVASAEITLIPLRKQSTAAAVSLLSILSIIEKTL